MPSDGVQQRLASVTAMDSTVKFRVGLRLLAQIGLLEDVGERDGQRQFHLWPVKSRIDMQTPMRRVEARRKYKRAQPHNMMAYCESADCRCQQVLDHFGDPEPLLATSCCGPCERPRVRRSATAPSACIGARPGRSFSTKRCQTASHRPLVTAALANELQVMLCIAPDGYPALLRRHH